MRINRDYFWFRLFKTQGIGPKLLVSIAEILEMENLDPEMVPRSQSDLSAQFPELAKILNGKIRTEDREKVSEEYEALKSHRVDIIYPGHSVDISVSNITFLECFSSVSCACKLGGVIIIVKSVNIVAKYETFKFLRR